MREIYCPLHNDLAPAADCREHFLALEDPGAVDTCRQCVHHQAHVVDAGEPASAESRAEGQPEKAKPAASARAHAAWSIHATLRRLAGYAGVGYSTVSYIFYAWKKTGKAPTGEKGKAVIAWLAERGLTLDDIAVGNALDFGPLPGPVEKSLREEPPAPKPEPPATPAAKITEVCVLSRPAPAPMWSVEDAGDPDAPAEDLDPVREAARYGIHIPDPTVEPPTVEGLLTSLKRLLPLGAKITIEL